MPDVRWGDPSEYGERDRDDLRPRVYDERDRDDHDPRDGLMHDLDLPRGEERELVVDRDRVYELNGEDGRTLAIVGAFRVVPEHDLDIDHETLEHSHSLTSVATHRTLPASSDPAKLPDMVGAVIYVRVSTKEQTENLSLPTQLRSCEEYCRREGYEILKRFREECESAKTADRPQLQPLLKYCRTHKGKVHFFVVFNLTRFAREKYDHFALRSHLKSLGISLRSATEPIDDTATGKLMDGVLAAFAPFDNDVRSLVHDPERAPLVRPAFEDYATGRYTKEQLLKQVRAWGLTNGRGKPLTSHLPSPGDSVGACAEHGTAQPRASRLPVARLPSPRILRTRPDRQLAKGRYCSKWRLENARPEPDLR